MNPSFSGERYGIGFWALSLGPADREKAESGIGRGVVLEIRKSMPKLDRARAPRASLVVVCWAALEMELERGRGRTCLNELRFA